VPIAAFHHGAHVCLSHARHLKQAHHVVNVLAAPIKLTTTAHTGQRAGVADIMTECGCNRPGERSWESQGDTKGRV
jgi:hypothetical protein